MIRHDPFSPNLADPETVWQLEPKRRQQVFAQAAARGDMGMVQALLDRGIDVNDQEGRALRCAAGAGQAEAVGWLLRAGADPWVQDGHALVALAAHGAIGGVIPLALFMEKAWTKRGNTAPAMFQSSTFKNAMTAAAIARHTTVVEWLQNHGTPVMPALHGLLEAMTSRFKTSIPVSEQEHMVTTLIGQRNLVWDHPLAEVVLTLLVSYGAAGLVDQALRQSPTMVVLERTKDMLEDRARQGSQHQHLLTFAHFLAAHRQQEEAHLATVSQTVQPTIDASSSARPRL